MNNDIEFLESAINNALHLANEASEILAKVANGEKLTYTDVRNIGEMGYDIFYDASALAYNREVNAGENDE